MTVRTRSKKESLGVDPSGVCVRPGELRGAGGRLSSSRANSRRVNAEWADRTGQGGPRKTAQLEKLAGPVLPVPVSPGLAPSPRGVGRMEVKEGGTPNPNGGIQLAPTSQGEWLMAGTVTTRKHATHARTLDATGQGACAQA